MQRLDHAALGVRDLGAAQRWLAGVLSMEPFRADDAHFADDSLAMVRNGAALLALLRLPDGEGPLQGSRSQKGHVAFRVSNEEFGRFRRALPALLQEHRAHADQRVDVEEQDYGVQRSVFFHDPDGNELEVTAWFPEEEEPSEARGAAFLREALLLDVRTAAEFREVALPKSMLVPHTALLDAESGAMDRVLAAVEGDRRAPIATYCAAGVRSAVAKAALEAQGFTNVQNWVNIETILRQVGQPA